MIQRIETPALTALMKAVTALGTEMFYIPVILFIFWWIDEKRGLQFGILIVISAWVNTLLKDILKQPRPFNFEPALGLAYESSYGAPSGHAQTSLCFWIPLAAWEARVRAAGEKLNLRRWMIWLAAVFIVLLIGFTRLYLGVHFPTDLFAGWITGGIIIVIWFTAGPRLEGLFARVGLRMQNICIAILALIMNGLTPRDGNLPALFLGFCIGYTLMKKYFPFSARGEIGGIKPGLRVMLFRCLAGFAGMAIIYLGLRFILPGEGSLFREIPIWGAASPFYALGRFIRYGLLGLWASAGAPLVFQRLGLASK